MLRLFYLLTTFGLFGLCHANPLNITTCHCTGMLFFGNVIDISYQSTELDKTFKWHSWCWDAKSTLGEWDPSRRWCRRRGMIEDICVNEEGHDLCLTTGSKTKYHHDTLVLDGYSTTLNFKSMKQELRSDCDKMCKRVFDPEKKHIDYFRPVTSTMDDCREIRDGKWVLRIDDSCDTKHFSV